MIINLYIDSQISAERIMDLLIQSAEVNGVYIAPEPPQLPLEDIESILENK